MQCKGMKLTHQTTQNAVDLLVPLDSIEPFELITDDYRLVVRLLATTVHVALVEHLQMQRLKHSKR